jgi:hypothetical protein
MWSIHLNLLSSYESSLTSFVQRMPKHEEKSVWSMDVDPDVVTVHAV